MTAVATNNRRSDPTPDHFDRLPPQNLQAEQSLLGGLLLHPPAFDDVAEIVRAEDFYSDANRTVFAALRDMHAAGRTAIDAITVSEFLKTRGELATVGGVAYISELLETVPHAAHSKHYAEIVRDKARRRHAEICARLLLDQVHDDSIETDELFAAAENELHLAIDDARSDGPQHIGEILIQAMGDLAAGTATAKPVPTTFREIDEMIGGFPIGGLTILGARPSAGKTAWLTAAALRIAEAGTPVLFSSYEQNRPEMTMRFLSIFCSLPYTRIVRGQTTSQENAQMVQAAEMLKRLPIYLDDDMPDITRLQSMVRMQVRKRKVKVAIVDYLQLIEPADKRINREQQIAGMTRALKKLGMNLGIAMVVASQLNRDVEKRQTKRPSLSDLRESGAIEQDADVALLLWRPNEGQPDGAPDDHGEIVVAKQRNGPRGPVKLMWNAPTMTYRDKPSNVEFVNTFDPE